MAYSFTEKKRIRKDFGKLPEIMEIPYLLSIQIDSYNRFLQLNGGRSSATRQASTRRSGRCSRSSAIRATRPSNMSTIGSASPCSTSRNAFRVALPMRRPLRVRVRLIIYDRESATKAVKDVKEQEVYMGEIPLMTENGTFVINGTERVVVSQLHRSPGVFFDHDRGKTHSSGKLLYSGRVIPYRGSWLDFEFDPKDCVFVRIDRRRKLPATILLRALGFTSEQMLEMFFETNEFHVKKDGFSIDLIPERMRGDVASFEIKDKKGERIVEVGRRITARHVRLLEKAGLHRLDVPREYLLVTGHRARHRQSGYRRNSDAMQRDDHRRGAEQAAGGGRFDDRNDLHERTRLRPLHFGDAAHRPTRNRLEALVEIYRMMRPGRAADQGSGREPVQQSVLLERALRSVGGRSHEVQPSARS